MKQTNQRSDVLLKNINDLNVDDLRQELFYWMQENPCTIFDVATVIGIKNATLEGFLYNTKKRGSDMRTVLGVKKFLRDKYKERDESQGAL